MVVVSEPMRNVVEEFWQLRQFVHALCEHRQFAIARVFGRL